MDRCEADDKCDIPGRPDKTWLFAITFRVVQRLQRDKFRQQRHTARYVREQPPAVVDAASETERAEYLRYLLALLPNPQRAIARRCASWCAAARARIRFWRAPFARQHPSSPMLGRLLRACTPLEPAVSPSAVDFPKIDK